MNDFRLAVSFTPTIVCIVAALGLAAHNLIGWGWFLFAAVVLMPHWRSGSTLLDDDEDEEVDKVARREWDDEYV